MKSKPRRSPRKTQTSLFDHFQPTAPGSSSSPARSSPSRPTKRPRRQSLVLSSDSSEDLGAIRLEDSKSPSSKSSLQRVHKRAKLISLIDEELDKEDSPRKTRNSGKRQVQSDSDETGSSVRTRKDKAKAGANKKTLRSESEEDGSLRVYRRRLVKGTRNMDESSTEDEDLLQEVDESRIIKDDVRISRQPTEFARTLDKLKRRKQGKDKHTSPSTSEGEESVEEILDFSGQTSRDSPFAEAHPDSDLSDSEKVPRDKGKKRATEFEDWIVHDNQDLNDLELPEEFSMNSHQELSHHFKIVCQLFVHLAIQPPRKRKHYLKGVNETQYFSVPLRAMRRRLSSTRDSVVASSTWRTGFKTALEKYPVLTFIEMEYVVPGCDACHLGNRKASILGRLSGSVYDRDTFVNSKPAGEEHSDASETDGLTREFNLGRFCARRTRSFHSLCHWQRTLFNSLFEEVDLLRNSDKGGGRMFVRMSGAWEADVPEDVNNGNDVMDWLDRRGIIQQEWRRVKDMMEVAQNLDVATKSGGADDDLFS